MRFYFLGGLQFNFVWANRVPYTQYVFDPATLELVKTKAGNNGYDSEFYIAFDW